MAEGRVEIRDLSFRYRRAADEWPLRHVDLTIEPGEYVLLCGASGSGKSTLCRAIVGLIPHFHQGKMEGTVRVAGLDTREHPVHDLFAVAGLVFQTPQWQLFNSTVERELAFGLESLGLPRAEMRHRIDRVADLLRLGDLLTRHPQQLSTGEQVLVAVGAILAAGSSVIVLDEPFANLDWANAQRVRAALHALHRNGITILVAEHRLSAVVADATRMIILHQGEVVADGPPRLVLAEDLEPFHLQAPLPARIGRAIGMEPLPLTIEELRGGLGMARIDGLELANARVPPAGSPGRPILTVSDLAHSEDGRLILDGISFQMKAGECVAIVGANGAGKTTLIKHFNGLRRPQRGSVRVAGFDVRSERVSTLARHVGMVFQNPNDQFFAASVRDEVAAGARALGLFDPRRVDAALEAFDLTRLADRSPFTLSEGEKRRVTLASATVTEPSLLVLDEPTTGQDWRARQALARMIRGQLERGRAVVLVSHDLEFAEEIAGRWLVLGGGRLLADGSPPAIMDDEEVLAAASLAPTARHQLAHLWREREHLAAVVREAEG
ncbi:MAG: hypothetical protein Kow0047_02480 [Anaerolineae bacterium]